MLLIGCVENVLQPIRNATQIWEVSTSSVWNLCTPFSDVITRNVGFFLRLVILRLNAFTFYLSKLMSNRYSQFQPSVSELNVPVFIRFKYHTR